MKNVLTVIGVFILISLGARGLGHLVTSQNNDTKVEGLEYSVEAFNATCMTEATSGGNVTEEVARQYCTCVYDKGVAEMGVEGWSDHMVSSDKITPEVNSYINACIVEVMNG